jgi:hypothetical protein
MGSNRGKRVSVTASMLRRSLPFLEFAGDGQSNRGKRVLR